MPKNSEPKNQLDPSLCPSFLWARSGGELPSIAPSCDLRDGIPEELRQKMKPKTFPKKKLVLSKNN